MDIIIYNYGVALRKRSELLVIKSKDCQEKEIPLDKINQITIETRGVTLSTDLIWECMKKNILITFLDYKNKLLSSYIANIKNGNYAKLRLEQLKASQNIEGLLIAERLIYAKLKNQSYLLKYFAKINKNRNNLELYDKLRQFSERIEFNINNKLLEVKNESYDYETARYKYFGIEADAATYYWSGIKLILPKVLRFNKRIKKGAEDLFNAALNYGYGILYSKVLKIIIDCHLDPYVSFLHSFKENHPSLLYDLIEQFRQYVVDRSIVALIHKNQKLQLASDNLLDSAARKIIAGSVIDVFNNKILCLGKKLKFSDIMKRKIDRLKDTIIDKKTYNPFTMAW